MKVRRENSTPPVENTEESISYRGKTAESVTSERLYRTTGYSVTSLCSRKKWNDVHAQFTHLNASSKPTESVYLVKINCCDWIALKEQ